MTKARIILIISLILVASIVRAQRSAYYDAFDLKALAVANGGKFKLGAVNRPIFDYYYGEGLSDAQLTTLIQANPFLSPYFEGPGMQNIGRGISLSGLVSSVGNLNVTNIADGLAKFLVERTKQELSITFFDRFKRDLDSLRQLQILFPTSYQVLGTIDTEIYNYAAYIDLLRESFQKDLALLLPNIRRLVNDHSMDEVFKRYPSVQVILSDALFIVNELNGGVHPGEAVHQYVTIEADSASLQIINPHLYPAVKTLDMFSQSLRAKHPQYYWVSGDSIQLLMKDKMAFPIYFGLIYQQTVKERIYFNGVSLHSIIGSYAAKIDSLKRLYEPYLTALVEKGRMVDHQFRAIRQLQEKGEVKPSYQDYYQLYDAAIIFLEHLGDVAKLLPVEIYLDEIKMNNYFMAARSLGNIYVDVYEKQYASAIITFSSLYKNLTLRESNDLKGELDATVHRVEESSGTEREQIKARKKKLEEKVNTIKAYAKKHEHFISAFIRYGNFAAIVAKAETSDDVKNAIEAAALPAGSARIKRETSCNVALNAFVGLYAGGEKIMNVDDDYQGTFGLSAPIGVTMSKGHSLLFFNTRKGWSTSLFISFIDIGALASFRFSGSVKTTNDTTITTSQIPEIQLKDIISPGAFLSLGIPKTPLSINLGAQVGPNLRKVTVTDASSMDISNQYADSMYWRLSVSLVVDIPLLNFYTRTRKYNY